MVNIHYVARRLENSRTSVAVFFQRLRFDIGLTAPIAILLSRRNVGLAIGLTTPIAPIAFLLCRRNVGLDIGRVSGGPTMSVSLLVSIFNTSRTFCFCARGIRSNIGVYYCQNRRSFD